MNVPTTSLGEHDTCRTVARPRSHSQWERGSTISRYVVLEPLGRGGMGVVLKAYDSRLRREIALKLVRRGALDPRAQDRLLREAQAMAQLNHPNVVAVYDVEDTPDGVLLAMELVAGRTLHRWLKQQHDWRSIVEALLQAGRGLAAAHRQGLVHRDFKPGNVLVGDDGRVRVTDFGLARSTGRGGDDSRERWSPPDDDVRASPDTTITRVGAVMGTVGYMAPEQHEGAPPDPSTDQYAFCVTLWTALCGRRPFEAGSRVMPEVQRMGPPPWPRRVHVPRRLVDAIVRGLAPQPHARWPDMEALLDELQRLVRPRRGRARWGLVGGSISAATIVAIASLQASTDDRCTGGAEMIGEAWNEARRASMQHAIRNADAPYAESTAEHTARWLDRYAQAWVEMYTEACEATNVRAEQSPEILDRRMACLHDRRLELGALVDVLLQPEPQVIERAVEMAVSLPPLQPCRDIPRLLAEVSPPDDPGVAAAVDDTRAGLTRALVRQQAGLYDSAIQLLDPLIQRAASIDYPPLRAELAYHHGTLLVEQGRYDEAMAELRLAYREALQHRHDAVATQAAIAMTGVLGVRTARPAESESWGETALALARRRHAVDLELEALNVVGNVLYGRGRFTEALDHLERVLALAEEHYGVGHLALASYLNNLGTVCVALGEYPRAVDYYEHALELQRSGLAPEHPDVASTLNNLAIAHLHRGAYEEAAERHRRALAIRRASFGNDHPFVAASLLNLGAVLHARGEFELAATHYRDALRIQRHSLGNDHPDVATSLHNLGILQLQQGRAELAVDHFSEAITVAEARLGVDHPAAAAIRVDLGTALAVLGDFRGSLAANERALASLEPALGREHRDVARAELGRGLALLELDRLPAARSALQRSIQALAGDPLDRASLANARFGLARVLWSEPGRRKEAEELARQAEQELRVHARTSDELIHRSLRELRKWLATRTDDGA